MEIMKFLSVEIQLKSKLIACVKDEGKNLTTLNVALFQIVHVDALPTPWRTQMWVQVKDNGRGRSRGTFPSSQHFEG